MMADPEHGQSDSPGGDESPSPRPPVDARGSASPPPPPPPPTTPGGAGYMPPVYAAPAPAPRGSNWFSRLIASVAVTLLLASLALNVYLGVMVTALTGGPTETVYAEGDPSQRIVILPIEGLIDGRKAEFVHSALRMLRDNPPRALVLRVDSGGGFVAPSDQIWDALERFRQDVTIPVIASFGSTAASGGYYVAASSDAIVAEPTTITGSIGVIAQAFTFGELLDKIGVTPEVIASTESTKKDMLNPMRPWTDADRAKLRGVLDHAYERFVDVVHQGRGLTIDEVKKLATGEVYTVDAAIGLKLVDQKGYLADAVALAASKAGIAATAQPRVTVIGPGRGFGLGGLLGSTHAPSLADIDARDVRRMAVELSTPELMFHVAPPAP